MMFMLPRASPEARGLTKRNEKDVANDMVVDTVHG